MESQDFPLQLRVEVVDTADLAILKYYVQQYGSSQQLHKLKPGGRLHVDVPHATAAKLLWRYVAFTRQFRHRIALEKILTEAGITVPAIKVTLKSDIGTLDLNQATYNALKRGGVNTVGDLKEHIEGIKKMPDVSTTRRTEIINKLVQHGFIAIDPGVPK